MASVTAEFGYFPYELDQTYGPISISTLPGLAASVAAVHSSGTVHKDWVYAPQQLHRDIFNDSTYQLPYASRIFGLPRTHVLKHESADGPEHLQFLVWCLAFFEGMRLTTTERGFLDATPIKRGALTDFVLRGNGDSAIYLAEKYWQQNHSQHRRTKRIEAIIHALFLSSHPLHLEFERFMYLYMALDGCYELTRDVLGGKSPAHGFRIEWMCQKFKMPVPSWAQPVNNKTLVSVARNDTLHEALFNEEPLGFAAYVGVQGVASVPLQMHALVCRLLVALLGRPDCVYVQTSVDARQRYSLDLA